MVLQFSLNFLLNCGIILGCNQNLKINFVVFLTPLPQLIVYLLCIHPQFLSLHVSVLKRLQSSILNFLLFGIEHVYFAIQVGLVGNTEAVHKMRFVFSVDSWVLIEKRIGLWFQFYDSEQAGVLGILECNRIQAVQLDNLRFDIKVHAEPVYIHESLPEMHNSLTLLDKLNERILAPEVGVCLIQNKPIFDCNNIVPEFNQANIFVVAGYTKLLPLTHFYIVVQLHFSHFWDLCRVSLNCLHPKTEF